MIKGLFDIEFRREDLTRNGDPLVRLKKCVDWELFRSGLEVCARRNGRVRLGASHMMWC